MEKFIYEKELKPKPESKAIKMFNNLYKQEGLFFGAEPSEITVRSIENLSPDSRILDLGCGEGKDASYLAANGFNVTAVDASDVGIAKLEKLVQEKSLDIKTVISDIESFLDRCDSFDAIYCLNVLQFLSEDRVLSVIEKMQNKTNPGGFNVITSFVAQSQKERDLVLSAGEYRFNEGELRDLYNGWDISFYEEALGSENEEGYRHYNVRMIAQKPQV